VIGIDRQTVSPEGDDRLVPELLGGDLDVAGIAEIAGVLVLVAAAQGEGYDVIHDRSNGDAASILAS
jgi:hypothetical protein